MAANLLLELAPIHGRWTDSDGGIWEDSDGGIWEDGISLLASKEGFSGNRWWGDYVISVDSPQYQLENIYGGYCALRWGSITLAQEIFNNRAWWPPIRKMPCVFYFTTTDEDSAEVIFDGTAHLSDWSKEGITYDLYGKEYTIDLLEEDTDYNEETVTLPRAFGNVYFQIPVRLADVDGKPTYHKAYLSGTISTNWHVYDDGVNIDTNVTDNGDGTFSLNASPVGEVSISGSGELNTLTSLFSWACGSSKLNLTYNSSLIGTSLPNLSYWADGQTKLIDFLSEVSSYYTHLFYISENTLYLVSMSSDNGTSTYTEHDIKAVQYSENSPNSLYKSSWLIRESFDGKTSDSEITTYYIKETEKETSLSTNYSYGKEININPLVETKDEIDSRLVSIKDIFEKTNAVVGIPMENGDLPVPGKKISWSESESGSGGSHIIGISGYIRARSIIYDFQKYIVNLSGEGEFAVFGEGYIMDEFGEMIGDGFNDFIGDGIFGT